MASEAAHLAKADANQAFLDTISDQFPDWLAIVAFYKAVHLVEALFARQGAPSHNHGHRNRRLKKRYPSIWRDFAALFRASTLLRYTDHEMSAEVVRRELMAKRLSAVESRVRRELGLPESRGGAANDPGANRGIST
jgi:hypothetical protein